MILVVAWVLFPLLLSVLALGCGLFLRSASGYRIPAVLLLPGGAPVMIVAASLATASARTAPLAIPLVVTLAVAGLGLALPWRPRRGDPSLALSALAVYAVYAAPVVLSGQATFAGFIKLDDTATFLAFTDRVMQHGRSLAGLAPSSYRAALAVNIPDGYPLGAFLPLGIGTHLVGTDPAWLYQPCIAFFAAMLALGLATLLTPLVRSCRLRALAAFVAAQAALIYGYSLWGGLKELVATFLVVTAAVFAPILAEELRSARRLLPFAFACAALLAVLNVSGGFWLLPLALPAFVHVARQRTRRSALPVLEGVGVTALLALPTIVIAHDFYRYTTSNLLTQAQRLGNLPRPLNLLQIFGIWPSGDFRVWPFDHLIPEILIAVAALAAAATVALALRRRQYRLPLLVVTVVLVALLLERVSSPWLAGKAYATASPVLVLTALALAAIAFERDFKIAASLLGALIIGGVLWSNVLAYHDVWLAPRAQLQELEQIGDRFSGQGPALMTEYQPYGVRHFLRGMDAEGASELRVRPIPLASGKMLDKGKYADLDLFSTSDLLVYRSLVLRRSPVESRPPAPYALVWRGRYYELWQRPDPTTPQVLEHFGLGDSLHAVAVPSCAEVRRLGTVAAQAGGSLVAAPRTNSAVLDLARVVLPAGWLPYSAGQMVTPTSDGTLTGSITLSRSGTYTVYLGGSFARTVTISIDGRRAGSLRGVLTEASQWTPFGTLRLSAGSHSVSLRYSGSVLTPGSGAGPFMLGPLALSLDEPSRLVSVAPTNARSLCGKSLDWIEAVGP
jgi:hypothetical protein